MIGENALKQVAWLRIECRVESRGSSDRYAAIGANPGRTVFLLVDRDVFVAEFAAVGVRGHRVERVLRGGLSLPFL